MEDTRLYPIGTRVKLEPNNPEAKGRHTGIVSGHSLVAAQLDIMPPAMYTAYVVRLDDGSYLYDDRQIYVSQIVVHPSAVKALNE